MEVALWTPLWLTFYFLCTLVSPIITWSLGGQKGIIAGMLGEGPMKSYLKIIFFCKRKLIFPSKISLGILTVYKGKPYAQHKMTNRE